MTGLRLVFAAVGGVVAAYFFFRHGLTWLSAWVAGRPAPLPENMVLLYTILSALGILLYVSVREERWRRFRAGLAYLLAPEAMRPGWLKLLRAAALAAVPVWAAWQGWQAEAGGVAAPVDPPGVHFNLPARYQNVRNPLPWTQENIQAGGVIYSRRCAPCHGPAQQGKGIFAGAWQPRPANFRDPGTIAQVDETYLYWRIREGGRGLPPASMRYRSAMPAWAGRLKDREIWQVILYEYTAAGQRPARRSP